MIKPGNLFRLQSKLTKNNKSMPVVSLEKDYVLTWILVGISRTELSEHLCFKGGTALKKFYFKDYRFSEDLDFTFLKNISIEEIKKLLRKVYSIILKETNMQLALKNIDEHSNSYVFYFNYSGPLGANIGKRQVKIDFTVDEMMIYSPNTRSLNGYSEYSDIPAGIELKVYSLKEIFIEKYLSILDMARNEPRDIYDMWFLTAKNRLDYDLLGIDIKKKGNYKGQRNFNILEILNYKESRYKKLWDKRLRDQMIDLPYFDEVYRELKKRLKILNDQLT